jgi:hypothetical protein
VAFLVAGSRISTLLSTRPRCHWIYDYRRWPSDVHQRRNDRPDTNGSKLRWEIVEKTHCHMVSISDAFTPTGRTAVQVIWDLSVKKIDAETCEYTNSVIAHPTEEFMAFLKEHNV